MGVEKGSTKGSGFFYLFDWSRKSRKKLFSSGSVSPESIKHEKRSQDSLSTACLRLVDDNEIVKVSSRKGSSDFSCASSVTDEEGITLRASGVVAKLMGLDSMPMSGVSEPNSTPFFDIQSLRDKRSHKISPEFYINDQFNHVLHKTEGYTRKPMESISQKMPSSPIERFQTETLPPRSAKSLPIMHHRLLTPIKNPGFISVKNAAHIMEAAAKILDPRDQPSTRPSSVPLRIRNSKENMVVSQSHRTSRILESARTPVDSNELRYLGGQSLNRSWNGRKDNAVFRRSQDSWDACPADVKGKGKSISLAIQAKVNIQRREGLSSSPRNSVVQKVHDECSFSQHFKSPPTNQKNKQKKQPSAINTSGVLRPNKQKQNCMSGKGKLSSKQSMSNEMNGRKVLRRHSSSTKNMTSNKISGNFRFVHNEKEGSLSSNKDFLRKKRLMESSFVSDKIAFIDDVLLDRREKRIQPNVVVDEHSCSRQKEDYRSDGADVVSFTFTSPLRKPTSRSQFFTQVAENLDNVNMHCFGNYNQKKDNDANDKKLHSHGLNVINGDAFNLFLEQKLRELTSRADPSCGSILNSGSSVASLSILQDPASDLNTIDNATVEHKEEQAPRRDKPDTVFGYGISSTSGQMHGSISFQEVLKYNSGNEAQRELDNQHASSFSILEASFSNESYSLTEFSDSSDGSKTCTSSIQAQCNASFNSASRTLSTEAKMELSDSASSTITETSDELEFSNANHTKASNRDLDYVREILSDVTLVSKDMLVNPFLFDKLEDKRWVKDKDGRLKRKVLFDCVTECLDSKCSRYFRSGYRAWSKGIELVCGKQSLAHEVHDEILRWMGMGDWMVDELVDNDTSSHLGKWLDHEIEAFEEGLEIQSEIVDSLVDEVIADCLVKAPCL